MRDIVDTVDESVTPPAAAGLPEIDLHDVRRSYATVGRDAKINWKASSPD